MAAQRAHKTPSTLGFVILALAVTRPAYADGAYFITADEPAAVAKTTNQRAVMVFDAGLTTMVVETGFVGDATSFMWLIPSSSNAQAFDAWWVDPDVFDALHKETAPKVVAIRDDPGVCGCELDVRTEITRVTPRLVETFRRDRPKIYRFNTLSPSIEVWMQNPIRDPAWVVTPEGNAVIDRYQALGYYFVGVDIDGVGPADPATPPEALSRPLAIQLLDHQPFYPLNFSSITTDQEIDLELYVIARERYVPINFPVVEMRTSATFDGMDQDAFDAWYEAQLEPLLSDTDGQPAFVVEYADFVGQALLEKVMGQEHDLATVGAVDWFVTRMVVHLTPSDLESDRDVELAVLEGEPANQRFRVQVTIGGVPQRAAIPWGLAVFAGVLWVSRRQRRASTARSRP